MEAGRSPSGGLGAELDRIEAAVDAGDTDLRQLGFWRVVALVKRDDALIERYADQVGRIDAKAFRAAPFVRLPVWVGLALMVAGLGVGSWAAWTAVLAGPISSSEPHPPTAGVSLLIAAGAWAASAHSFAHYVVGRFVGILFTDFFFAIPPPPLPGLKTDYATYLRASATERAWMHASGAIATKLAPFAALALAPASGAPAWSIGILVGFGLFQIATDVLFSTKASDWKKVRRELAVARARRTTAG